MTEWIISGNPKKYDVINAFRNLKTIDWTQSANMVAGDIVYIYVSGDIKAIMFRCRVNAADMDDVNIDDSEYNVSGQFDGSAGRYMELEMLEEFSGNEYTREELMKHGFSSPMGPVRMPESVKTYIESVSTAGIDNKRFSVNNSIWIAAATYAFMKYKKNIDVQLTDCYITAPQIQKIAAEYTTQDVQAARIHQHCNGDHENPTHRYLRRIGKDGGGVNFRITAKGEFKDNKEIPNDLNWDEKIVVDGQGVVLKELYDFVAGPYLELVQSSRAATISPEHAVWIAAACMTDDACKKKKAKFDKDDVLFDADEIVKNAVQLIGEKATDTTVNSVTAMLNDDNIHFFVSVEGKYRISYMSEFRCINECPPMDVLNKLPMIEFGGKSYDFKRVFEFVNTEYTERAKRIFKKVTIDYIGLLDYLEKNREIPYSNPDSVKNADEKARLLEVKKKGQAAQATMKQIVDLCYSVTKLNRCEPMSWLDGSNTKTRKYLWAQMKYSDYAKNPTSVSVFVEAKADTAYFRISLEIKNDSSDKAEIKKYHSHLDIPANTSAGLVYVTGSNEWGHPEQINEDVATIRQRLDNGDYRKIQICKIIPQKPDQTNEYFESEIIAAAKALIPYYEHVLGIKKIEYWPSLSEYDPGITKEKWLELLNNPEVTLAENMRMFKMMLELGGESTCANLAEVYGGSAASYNGLGRGFGERVHKNTGCPLCMDEERERYYTIPFVGRSLTEKDKSRYSWKLRDELKEALEAMDLSSVDIKAKEAAATEFDKNMILYGPPGTGKTYNTAIYAVAICDGKSLDDVRALDYSAVMERYEQLKKVGRVAFTTFHQSYGYEEFIEGIKPIVDQAKNDIGYTIEPGVFKKFCDNARTIDNSATETIVNAQAQIWKLTIMNGDMNAVKQECFDEGNARMGFDYDAPEARAFVEDVAPGDIILSFKTRRSIDGIGVVTGDIEELGTKDTYQLSRNVFWLAKRIDEDITEINAGKLLHRMTFAKVPNMQLKDVLALAKKCSPDSKVAEIKENTVPYVFVIDEINRGNISKIFGELITLIENTKRGGMVEATSAILPYSGDTFCVPANVYILGTMNTADRSIALMDTALRRRFQFVEMMPDSKVISDVVIEGLDVAKMLDIINERIAFLYDREHTIGHAFFTGLLKPENRTVHALGSIFEKSVIPLLQEYFYEDYQKIQLVLGDNAKSNPDQKFIKDTKVVAKNIFVGSIEDIIDLPEKKFEINHKAFYDIESYMGIAQGLDVE